MHHSNIRRGLAGLVAAAVLAGLTVASVAAPAAAGKVKCQGQVATIVGTNKGERIVGTNRRDIIAARGGNDVVIGRGGNDIICGGTGADRLVGKGGLDRLYGNGGPDRLFGGDGPDRLFGGVGNDLVAGQAGNDLLNGGLGTDTCRQGAGTGPEVSCELPLPTLVIAYSDVNKNHVFDTGDVMISKIVDTDRSGTLNPGDTIIMGKYPTTPAAVTPAGVRETFEDWRVHSHTIVTIPAHTPTAVLVTAADGNYQWAVSASVDGFAETNGTSSILLDYVVAGSDDYVALNTASPSQPTSTLEVRTASPADDGFIDVEIYV